MPQQAGRLGQVERMEMVAIDRHGGGWVVRIMNTKGLITAMIYITRDGDTHEDSWLRPEGWQ